MTRSIYDEMCKPSPLSKPPKPEVKMLTLPEVLDMVRGMPKQERRATIEEWMKSIPGVGL